MASKKINSRSTSTKAANSRFYADVESILDVTFGSFGPIMRSKVSSLGQQSPQVPSTSTPVFGSSSSKGARSSTNTSEGGSYVAEKIKKTLALLDLSGFKHSAMKKDDDASSDGSSPLTPHSLANLMETIAGLTKFMQNQKARIEKLTDRVGILMEEESTHAPGKLPEVLESDSPPRQAASTKAIHVSSEGMIPIDQLKELIKGTIKNKYEVAAKSSLTYAKPPWIHENKVVPSNYHQCLKYYEGKVEKTVIADDEPFTEAESHFADAKFYLKNRIVKELKVDDATKSKNDEPMTKRADVTIGKAKTVTGEVPANVNKSHKRGIASYGKKVSLVLQYVPKRKKDEGGSHNLQTKTLRELTLPVKRIEAVKLSSNLLAGFVAQNLLQNVALPTKRTDEGFDPNTYKLFTKAGYNPNEPSKLGKLPSEDATRQPRECLGYKQPSPLRISIRRASRKYISVEDESAASNRPSIFDRLGKSTMRTFERDEDEESVGSSYHVTIQGENGVLSSMEDNAELEEVSPCYHIYFNDGDPQEDEDAKDAPPELEEGVKRTVDALKEVNLGTDEEPRPTYLSVLLEAHKESTYIELLKEFRDVFAWSYKEMPDLDPKVAVHHLAVRNGACEHVSSIVPVMKKNGQIQVCVNFRDLNNACPKDVFLLPIPELMIDDTTRYEAMSFMDGSSGYNQIRMEPKDEELTAFRTLKSIYCYKVMPFGLKNAGATYQRAMQNIFDDLLHKNVECYVDDLVVKSRKKNDHMKDLRMLKHYFQAHVVRFVSKANPIKFMMSKLVLSDRLAKWYLQFQQFKILYIPQKAVKGQALADFLADHPIPDDWELTDELRDEDAMVIEVQPPWKMYFDGAAHRGGAGAGVVLVTPQGELVVNKLLGSYEVKNPELRPYHDYAKKLMGWLSDMTIQHVPRKENKKADALAALASSLALPDQVQVIVCQKWVVPPPNEAEGEENELKHLVAVSEVEKEEWRQPIIDYLCYGILP
ncbi:uncharacterized protein [Nicotiana sylvestris]|uniref:uncharacterized protein n=1 Tax=Nicotiana sylvestris TaxID=4096 RepID=UPI00388CBD0C